MNSPVSNQYPYLWLAERTPTWGPQQELFVVAVSAVTSSQQQQMKRLDDKLSISGCSLCSTFLPSLLIFSRQMNNWLPPLG